MDAKTVLRTLIHDRDLPRIAQPGRSLDNQIVLLGLLVLMFSLFHYGHALVKMAMESPFADFGHYFTYTTAVQRGLDPFDAKAVAQLDGLLAIRRAGGGPNYPPLFYVLMQPWVLLPFRAAALLWIVLDQILLATTLFFVLRRHREASPWQIATMLFVSLNYQPLVESLWLGQANGLILFLLTLAWFGAHHQRLWPSAVAITLCLHIKPQFGLLVPWLWWMNERPLFLRTLGLTLGSGLLSLLLAGPDHHLKYLRYIFTLPDHQPNSIMNISLRATFQRLFDLWPLGSPMADALWLITAGLLLWSALRTLKMLPMDRPDRLDLHWSLAIPCILLISPFTEEHHLVVLLLPIVILLTGRLLAACPRGEQITLAAILLFIAARYSLARFPAFHVGPLSLLAASKTFAIAGFALWLFRRASRTLAEAPPGYRTPV
jgi:hypothetical protein